MSSTNWKFMIEFIFGINGIIQSEFVFVDELFCPENKDELGLDSVDPENELYHEFPLGGGHVLHDGILDLTELR